MMNITDTIRLIKAIGCNDFWQILAATFRHYIKVDSYTVFTYQDNYLLRSEFLELSAEEERIVEQYFEKGAYALSPYYELICAGKTGAYQLKEVAPSGFESSSINHNYFMPSNIIDETSLICLAEEGQIVKLSIARHGNSISFNDEDIAFLRDNNLLISSLMSKHVSMTPASQEDLSQTIKMNITERLDGFGQAILTKREREIVKFIIRGHSVKSCAIELNLSPETVSVHRRNIYSKLNISNQGQLISQVLDYVISDIP